MPALNTYRAGGRRGCDGIRGAHVFNNTHRCGKTLFARRLGGKNMFSVFTTDPIAAYGALDLRLFGTSTTSMRSALSVRRFRPARVRPRGDKVRLRPASDGAFLAESADAAAR